MTEINDYPYEYQRGYDEGYQKGEHDGYLRGLRKAQEIATKCFEVSEGKDEKTGLD